MNAETMRKARVSFVLVGALSITLGASACPPCACTGPSSGPPPSGTYKGTFVAAGVSGVITLTFPTTAYPQAVTGQLLFTGTGSSVVLHGRYAPDSLYPLWVTGPGPTPTTAHTITSGAWSPTGPRQWEGDYFGPSGGGTWTAAAGSVHVLCGLYSRKLPNGTETAETWDLILSTASSNNLTGIELDQSETWLLGTYTAGSSSPNTSISFNWMGNDAWKGTATGNLTPPSGSDTNWTASGAWRVPVTKDSGLWSGSTSGC